MTGNLSIVELLLKFKANPNISDNVSTTNTTRINHTYYSYVQCVSMKMPRNIYGS